MDAAGHRAQAIEAHHRAWELLVVEPRTGDQDVELLTAAFASRHPWEVVGGAQERIVSDVEGRAPHAARAQRGSQ